MSRIKHSHTSARLLRIAVGFAFFALITARALGQPTEQPLQFNRDIRPILSENCFHCHGPDEQTREADLRLDQRDSALADRGGYAAISPGKAADSELVKRLHSDDPDVRMPPPDSGRMLTTEQIERLTRWIEQGASYEAHWAFTAPQRPTVPFVQQTSWPRNAVDYFILTRLEKERLEPSSEAVKTTLIRRVSLDLTGLPPTPAEVEAFLADDSPDAYERVVDRLLASPHYGEQMALDWLDAARFADTHGYLFDTARSMWRWRDWVIDAYNHDMPFDQFTIEQLAGDLLPNPTLSQQIATGFHRNHIINNEAGAIPEEYLVENVFDRVETTASVWLGLTMQCARCHDHKYEPITQREYYEFYAYFNSVPEIGLDGLNSNAKPIVKAPTALDVQEQARFVNRIRSLERSVAAMEPDVAQAQWAWELSLQKPLQPVATALVAQWPLDGDPYSQLHPCPAGSSRIVGGANTYADGILGSGLELSKGAYVDAGDVAGFDNGDSFTLSAWIRPTVVAARRSIISRMDDAEHGFHGYTLQIVEGKLGLYLVQQFPDELIFVQSKVDIPVNQWRHVAASYDGSGKAAGVTLFIDGRRVESTAVNDTLNKTFFSASPLWIGNGHPGALFEGTMDEIRIYHRTLGDEEVARLPGVAIETLVAIDPELRNREQTQRVRDLFLTAYAPAELAAPYKSLQRLRDEAIQFETNLPTVMVMQQQDQLRPTRILERGAYDRPGETVTAVTPKVLPALLENQNASEASIANRLTLARWLVDPRHPLTARVTVNRYWQRYFGNGLVSTTEDFGQQGEWPTHPELLDWLATEFIRCGWDVKAMQRLIVMSATYRQSAAVTAALAERDPQNKWYARGPRFRLPAETIRDQALAASGLLVDTIGGPSVRPYQPEGLWKEVAFDTTGAVLTAQIYQQDHGSKLYRRGLYTFWKRTSPPPTMLIFDAPNRERCTVRRDRTNTPLQALVVMNSPTFIEASRKLAERVMQALPDAAPAARASYAFQLLTCRAPLPEEREALVRFYEQQVAAFQIETASSLLKVGESPYDERLNPVELAAYTTLVSALMNLDEVLTRN